MHTLKCETPRWEGVDMFCRRSNGRRHISALLMYIWHHNDRWHRPDGAVLLNQPFIETRALTWRARWFVTLASSVETVWRRDGQMIGWTTRLSPSKVLQANLKQKSLYEVAGERSSERKQFFPTEKSLRWCSWLLSVWRNTLQLPEQVRLRGKWILASQLSGQLAKDHLSSSSRNWGFWAHPIIVRERFHDGDNSDWKHEDGLPQGHT